MIVYLDTETTGLDPDIHEVWEAAWAAGLEPIQSTILAHSGVSAAEDALRVNGYFERAGYRYRSDQTTTAEAALIKAVTDVTICCANPAFDAAFLRARWGRAPWKFRLLDIEAYAMGAFGWHEPRGLAAIATELRARGVLIPVPDHTAAGDVATLRACHLALVGIYAAHRQGDIR